LKGGHRIKIPKEEGKSWTSPESISRKGTARGGIHILGDRNIRREKRTGFFHKQDKWLTINIGRGDNKLGGHFTKSEKE